MTCEECETEEATMDTPDGMMCHMCYLDHLEMLSEDGLNDAVAVSWEDACVPLT